MTASCVGRLDDDLVGAHAVHPVVEALARPARARPRCAAPGTCWARRARASPVGSAGSRRGAAPRPRPASATPAPRRTRRARPCGGQRAAGKSEGRRARSVEMITQRPTTGSRRSSGMRRPPPPPASDRGRAGPRAPPRTGLPSKSTAPTSSQIGIGIARPPRQPKRRGDGAHALGDHRRAPPPPRRGCGRARSPGPSARLRLSVARARQHQVAEAGQAGEASRAARRARRRAAAISARPRVISAARAFSPRPRPSHRPVAMRHHVLERAAELDARARRGWCRGGRPAPARSPLQPRAPAALVRRRDHERGRLAHRRPRARRTGRRARRPAGRAAAPQELGRSRGPRRGSRPFVADTMAASAGSAVGHAARALPRRRATAPRRRRCRRRQRALAGPR